MAKAKRKNSGSAKPEPRPNGRPPDYKDEYAGLAHNYCLLGAKNDDLARMFGVNPRTVDRWLAEKPKFCRAVKEGREEADAKVASSLYHRANGYSHQAVKIFNDRETGVTTVPYTEHYPPDSTAMIFWLKNRRPDLWRDKTEHEHSAGAGLLETLEAARARAVNARRK